MPSGTVVVTDSTAYLPPGIAEGLPIDVIPLHVILGDQQGEDGIDVTPADVVAKLRDKSLTVTTSRPTPAQFVERYRALLEQGYEHIVSVHISSELSGTWDAARLAAVQCNSDAGAQVVRVVDSRVTAMALGFPVLVAARRAAAGAGSDEVYDAAVTSLQNTSNFFYVDTLEFLRRGGRIGAARAWLGTALAVKPILHLQDGRILPLEKLRTATRAIARLKALAVEAAAAIDGDVLVAVHHLAAPERAERLRAELAEEIPSASEIVVSEVGAVLGAHVGPGMLAVIVVPALR
ncbi:DegV family protein [Cumulibacter manganitolerans]|uniref:DegV family protein n=1 Tax=Cumulibacter manganitolerans TaxID=1884992 RepID=UPI001296BC4F|nr:DegV family protein [Cumulibacter manganitolerans]